MSQEQQPPSDLTQLTRISEGDVEFEVEVLQVYADDAAEKVIHMRSLAEMSDQKEMMAEAHHVKGASANVGAKGIQMLALQIEKSASNRDFEAVLALLDTITAELEQVELFITEHRKNLP